MVVKFEDSSLQFPKGWPGQTSDDGSLGPAVSSREKRASWSVDELADFLIAEDMKGPATTLQSASMNGADFFGVDRASHPPRGFEAPAFCSPKVVKV